MDGIGRLEWKNGSKYIG